MAFPDNAEAEQGMLQHRCSTPGCFELSFSGLCQRCSEGETPLRRGPVTARDLYFSKVYGGRDAEVTRYRLDHQLPAGLSGSHSAVSRF
ncbi:hypothetical protein [Azohydromonas lata]|uniref:Uncharacterized protein n=1 Tax=Azohydromonas lata TaxID=45677 RepID=A0ABU5IDT9_9BURK|nr:hypothetical protein [Azohydromonas lata]MDZ5457279.1 hypothetical protein [Azohydromonas lata]